MINLKTLKTKALKNLEVKEAYDALESEFALIDTLLTMRQKAGLTQDELAERMGTKRAIFLV
ncbi:helix-turn-helix domain-containing protein [Legionella tunisiensis]|uniref:helix-turn-helix domain-containing protein n=1 Tax=Legionella tunisiensis TaxID=1034944 RepID=UPI000302A49E|nr:hypothetical protein [Legionella tunisiensis]